MPWNSTDGIMTAPVGMGDIQQAIGLSSGDLGTLITQGAQGGLINIWSMYKPFRNSSVGYIWDSSYYVASATEGIFGLAIPYAQSLGSITYSYITTPIIRRPTSGFLYNLIQGSLDWEYLPPRGVNSSYTEPFRMLDFNGYRVNASSPMPYFADQSITMSSSGAFTLTATIPDVSSITNNITLDTLNLPYSIVASNNVYLDDCYLGVLVYNSYGECFWQTATVPLSDTSTNYGYARRQISFTDMSGFSGTWYMVPFFSNVAMTFCQVINDDSWCLVAAGTTPGALTLTATHSYTNTVKESTNFMWGTNLVMNGTVTNDYPYYNEVIVTRVYVEIYGSSGITATYDISPNQLVRAEGTYKFANTFKGLSSYSSNSADVIIYYTVDGVSHTITKTYNL